MHIKEASVLKQARKAYKPVAAYGAVRLAQTLKNLEQYSILNLFLVLLTCQRQPIRTPNK